MNEENVNFFEIVLVKKLKVDDIFFKKKYNDSFP